MDIPPQTDVRLEWIDDYPDEETTASTTDGECTIDTCIYRGLLVACEEGYLDIAEILLEGCRLKCGKENLGLIHLAINRKHQTVAAEIIKSMDVDNFFQLSILITYASQIRSKECVTALLNIGRSLTPPPKELVNVNSFSPPKLSRQVSMYN